MSCKVLVLFLAVVHRLWKNLKLQLIYSCHLASLLSSRRRGTSEIHSFYLNFKPLVKLFWNSLCSSCHIGSSSTTILKYHCIYLKNCTTPGVMWLRLPNFFNQFLFKETLWFRNLWLWQNRILSISSWLRFDYTTQILLTLNILINTMDTAIYHPIYKTMA